MKKLAAIFGLVSMLLAPLWGQAKNAEASQPSGLERLFLGEGVFNPLQTAVLRPFQSDGCSMSPDGLPGETPWVKCCIQHDIRYWMGGSLAQKQNADLELRQCLNDLGHPYVAQIYYYSVKMGGSPLSLNNFRWGYGWNVIRPYGELTSEEKAQGEALYGKDLVQLTEAFKENKIKVEDRPRFFKKLVNRLNHHEQAIFNFLANNLPRHDWAQQADVIQLDDQKEIYSLRLEKCAGEEVDFIFDSLDSDDFEIRDGHRCLNF